MSDTRILPNTGSRYGFIDATRGIAACLVMLQHALYESGLLGGHAGDKLTGFIPNCLELGEVGVVAFFLVSGFVIPLSLEKTAHLGVFWINRVLRIYPLYLAVFIITFAVKGGGNIHSIGAFLANFISHILFIHEYVGQEEFVGGSWTLSLEMVWYIGFSGLFVLFLNKSTGLVVGLAVLVSILAMTSCASGHHIPMGRLSMLLCCVSGLVCYRRSRNDVARDEFGALLMVLIATIAANLFVGFELFPDANPSATFRTAAGSWALAAVVFFVPFLTRGIRFWGRSGFNFLGRISYSVYLLHPVVLYLLTLTSVHGVLLIGVTFVLTIAASTMTYELIEAPPIRFGHSLKSTAKWRTLTRESRGPSVEAESHLRVIRH